MGALLAGQTGRAEAGEISPPGAQARLWVPSGFLGVTLLPGCAGGVHGPSALMGAGTGAGKQVVGLTASSPSSRARGFAFSTNHFAALGSYSLFRVTASSPAWSQLKRGQVPTVLAGATMTLG